MAHLRDTVAPRKDVSGVRGRVYSFGLPVLRPRRHERKPNVDASKPWPLPSLLHCCSAFEWDPAQASNHSYVSVVSNQYTVSRGAVVRNAPLLPTHGGRASNYRVEHPLAT